MIKCPSGCHVSHVTCGQTQVTCGCHVSHVTCGQTLCLLMLSLMTLAEFVVGIVMIVSGTASCSSKYDVSYVFCLKASVRNKNDTFYISLSVFLLF